MSRQLVLLADVVNSRSIDDRERFRDRLRAAFVSVNETESKHLTVPVSTMKGVDEFGCILNHLAPLPDIIVPLLRAAHPHGIRFGVAMGKIDIGMGENSVAAMDGTAFHDASALLEDLRDSGLFVALQTGNQLDTLVGGALNLLAMGEIGVTPRQLEIIQAYETHGTQVGAAESLDIHQQAVSESLKRAQYGQRDAIRTKLRQALEELYD